MESALKVQERGWLKSNAEPNMSFVAGDWGFGKTHLRMLLVDSFLTRGVPFIHDHVDSKGGSLAHLHRAVPRWLESLELGVHVGLREVFQDGLKGDARILDWCVKRGTRFGADLALAMNGREWAWSQAVGHQYQFPGYSYQHFKALEILTECSALFGALGKGGIALLLDEAENVSRQHDVRGRRKTYDTFGRLADQRHLFNVVFITDRFIEQVKDDIERGRREGWSGWTAEAKKFVSSMDSIPIFRPPTFTVPLATSLVEKVSGVYDRAFAMSAPGDFSRTTVDIWRQTATRSVRLLVRMAIEGLDCMAR